LALDRVSFISGNAHPALADKIAEKLNITKSKVSVSAFSDGEVNIEILDNIRGRDIFLIQPTCPPGDKYLFELLALSDACKRASCNSITAVIPYFGFARQDRRTRATRGPITAKLVARLLEVAGIDRVLTVDLHAEQIQGFFDIPLDNVYASPVLLGDVWKQKYSDVVVVSPDVGGVVRARALAKRLGDAELAIIDKRRPQANVAEVMNVIGNVKDKTCVIIDDLIDTAGTLCAAADVLKSYGAKKVVAYITHPVLSGPAISRIEKSNLDELVVTDTIPLTKEAKNSSKIRQLSITDLLAETIRRISDEESVSSLYLD
jgi:ribose-phosphate pyrophosphokinase